MTLPGVRKIALGNFLVMALKFVRVFADGFHPPGEPISLGLHRVFDV
tara:strand:- start:188 stop:328 length:141 start_codon:yes stop_codon:yes gene_type:complete